MEREQYSTYHRRKLGPECFCVQNTKTRKKTHTHPQRKKDLSYAFIGACILCVVTQTSESIDFQGTGYGEPYFSTLPFQVFV